MPSEDKIPDSFSDHPGFLFLICISFFELYFRSDNVHCTAFREPTSKREFLSRSSALSSGDADQAREPDSPPGFRAQAPFNSLPHPMAR
jgi:hypothetical protein